MSTVLVTVATGQQGSAVARHVLANGHKVHALVRNPSAPVSQALASKGATLFAFNPDTPDLDVLRAALAGTTGLFLNTYLDPADPSSELTQVRTILRTAAALPTPPADLVLSTAFFTARHDEWSARDPNYLLAWYYAKKLELEREVRAHAFVRRWTILRPAWLMHNYLPPYQAFHYPELASQHALVTAYRPSTRMPHFSPDDLGAIGAAALTAAPEDARFAGKAFELGNENFTVEEAARILGEVLGTAIEVRYRSEEEEREAASKVPTQCFHVWARDNDLSIDVAPVRELGIRLTTLEEYFVQHREELRRALGLEG